MSIGNLNTPVSDNIERILCERGLKQNCVAQKSGHSPKELSDMLNGRKIIRVNDVPKIAKALGVEISELFCQTDGI